MTRGPMQLTHAASDRPDQHARDAAVSHFLMGEELPGSELERQTNQGARRRTGPAACKGPGMGISERIEPNVTAVSHERVQRRDQVTVSVHIPLHRLGLSIPAIELRQHRLESGVGFRKYIRQQLRLRNSRSTAPLASRVF
jgi:hypothetical protein